jgi:hypothetical protein
VTWVLCVVLRRSGLVAVLDPVRRKICLKAGVEVSYEDSQQLNGQVDILDRISTN